MRVLCSWVWDGVYWSSVGRGEPIRTDLAATVWTTRGCLPPLPITSGSTGREKGFTMMGLVEFVESFSAEGLEEFMAALCGAILLPSGRKDDITFKDVQDVWFQDEDATMYWAGYADQGADTGEFAAATLWDEAVPQLGRSL